MSAVLVSQQHIDQIVNLACDRTEDGEPMLPFSFRWADGEPKDKQQIGQMLLDANLASLQARYPDTTGDPEEWENGRSRIYAQQPVRRYLTVVEGLKALDCYDYQACEVPDYKTTEAARFIEALRRHLIRSLPGYADASWEYRET